MLPPAPRFSAPVAAYEHVAVRAETSAHATSTGASSPSTSVGGWSRSFVDVTATVNGVPARPMAGVTAGGTARSGGTVSTRAASMQKPE